MSVTAHPGPDGQRGLDLSDGPHGIRRLRITTRLDVQGVTQVEPSVLAVLTAPGARTIVDLSAVDFVGSLGLRVFFSAARAARGRDARFVLVGAQPAVQRVFDQAAVGAVVPIAAHEADAIERLVS